MRHAFAKLLVAGMAGPLLGACATQPVQTHNADDKIDTKQADAEAELDAAMRDLLRGSFGSLSSGKPRASVGSEISTNFELRERAVSSYVYYSNYHAARRDEGVVLDITDDMRNTLMEEYEYRKTEGLCAREDADLSGCFYGASFVLRHSPYFDYTMEYRFINDEDTNCLTMSVDIPGNQAPDTYYGPILIRQTCSPIASPHPSQPETGQPHP